MPSVKQQRAVEWCTQPVHRSRYFGEVIPKLIASVPLCSRDGILGTEIEEGILCEFLKILYLVGFDIQRKRRGPKLGRGTSVQRYGSWTCQEYDGWRLCGL